MNCASCRYSNVVEYDNGDIGLQCHRYPPTVFVHDGEVTQATPSVDADTWCGEWTDAGDPPELEQLRAWKAEAMAVLTEWEQVWDAAGRPGRLGSSKAQAVRRLLEKQAAS